MTITSATQEAEQIGIADLWQAWTDISGASVLS